MDEEAGCSDASRNLAVPQALPSSCRGGKHVVVVMDALKEFCTKPLEWAVEHLAEPGYVVTLLGVMPWPSLPLFCKTRSDIWTLDFEDLSTMKECPEWKNHARYQKVQRVVQLCEARGVVPLKKVAMGHPEQFVVLEKTATLHATWVVFDRHHRKWSTFYQKRIRCNMVIMNGDGQVDMLKVGSILDREETIKPGASLAPAARGRKSIIPKARTVIFNKESKKKVNEDSIQLE